MKQITILPIVKNWKKTDNTTVPPLGAIVYRKRPQNKREGHSSYLLIFRKKK
jgi:hypothetical protein